MVALKQVAFQHCRDYVESRFQGIQKEIEKVNESLRSETKSTAGDKHETGRAMLQLEREKLGKQLAEVEKLKRVLQKIHLNKKTERIALGSLVVTDSNCYYISISSGRVDINEQSVFCISPMTPIGQLLLGKTKGDTIHFNGLTTTIRDSF